MTFSQLCVYICVYYVYIGPGVHVCMYICMCLYMNIMCVNFMHVHVCMHAHKINYVSACIIACAYMTQLCII